MFLADIYGAKEGEEEKEDRQTLQVSYILYMMIIIVKLMIVMMGTMKLMMRKMIVIMVKMILVIKLWQPRWRPTTASWRRTE